MDGLRLGGTPSFFFCLVLFCLWRGKGASVKCGGEVCTGGTGGTVVSMGNSQAGSADRRQLGRRLWVGSRAPETPPKVVGAPGRGVRTAGRGGRSFRGVGRVERVPRGSPGLPKAPKASQRHPWTPPPAHPGKDELGNASWPVVLKATGAETTRRTVRGGDNWTETPVSTMSEKKLPWRTLVCATYASLTLADRWAADSYRRAGVGRDWTLRTDLAVSQRCRGRHDRLASSDPTCKHFSERPRGRQGPKA